MVYVKYLQCIQDGKMSKFSQNIDNIRFLGSLSMWIGISLIISFVISLILPFPWSLAVAICIFLLIYYCYVMRKLSKRIGNGYSAIAIALYDTISAIVVCFVHSHRRLIAVVVVTCSLNTTVLAAEHNMHK